MLSDRPFHKFNDRNEIIEYMRRYKIIAPTKKTIPTLFFCDKNTSVVCNLIGYEKNYDTFSIAVIDYGSGPYFIHVDKLKEMQSSIGRNKGVRIKSLPDSYIIFDTETTSKNCINTEIINIGAVRVVNGEVIDTFSSLVRPINPIPKKITELTGITDLDVFNAPDIKAVLPEFLNYIGDSVVAGYNIASYDTTIIYDLAKSILGIDFNNDFFDFMYFFKEKIPASEIENYKLSTIATYFGVDNSNAHHAIDDCMMCLDCYNAIIVSPEEELPENNLECVNNIKNTFEKSVVDMLNRLIEELELPKSSLYLYSNRSAKGNNKGMELSKSICIHEPEYPENPKSHELIGKNQVVLKINQKPNGKIVLSIRKYQFEVLEDLCPVEYTPGKLFYNIYFNENDPSILPFLEHNVKYCVKNYVSSNTFSCCSQFTKCSDELKCVHENKLYSTGCAYRHNLENGRIFYGKNRNID